MARIPVLDDLSRALALLSRWPVKTTFPDGGAARSAWAFPLVGLAVSGPAVALAWAAHSAGFAIAAVAVGLIVQVMLSGALHEDGLADTADGFWGGWTRERRLEIMKDSHIGSYGVIALALAFLWRWGLWSALLAASPLALLAAAVLSRATMPAVMCALPHAREAGLSHATGRPDRGIALAAVGFGIGLALLLVGVAAGVAMAFAAGIAAACVAWLAKRKIDGQTGDVLGATQVLSELASLSIAVAILAA